MTDVLPVPTARADAAPDRERVAERLIESSLKLSFDPQVDIAWDEPFEGSWFVPERLVSLYGTPLWDRMSETQRKELSRHEAVSMLCAGYWFELILDQILVRHLWREDPASAHARFALTEVGDETRHSLMFMRMVAKMGGAGDYGFDRRGRRWGWLLKTLARGGEGFAAALIAEEILDAGQREVVREPTCEPLFRELCRIHVTEEARHVSYARDELARRVAAMGPLRREWSRLVTLLSGRVIQDAMVDPRVYAAVGLDPAEAVRAAARNPARRAAGYRLTRRLVRVLTEAGLIGGPTRRLWEREGLVDRRPIG